MGDNIALWRLVGSIYRVKKNSEIIIDAITDSTNRINNIERGIKNIFMIMTTGAVIAGGIITVRWLFERSNRDIKEK
jgi:hypothetical protein